MKLEKLKKDIESGGEINLSAFEHILLADEEEFLAFMFELSYECKYQFYSFQHILAFHSTDIREMIKSNIHVIHTREDIRKLFNSDFYDYKFQWDLLDNFISTIE